MIKLVTSAAALCLTATSAFAGGYVAPAVDVEPVIIEDAATSSNTGLILPAAILLAVVAAIASDSDDKQTDDKGGTPQKPTTDEDMAIAVIPPVVTEGGTETPPARPTEPESPMTLIPDSGGVENTAITTFLNSGAVSMMPDGAAGTTNGTR